MKLGASHNNLLRSFFAFLRMTRYSVCVRMCARVCVSQCVCACVCARTCVSHVHCNCQSSKIFSYFSLAEVKATCSKSSTSPTRICLALRISVWTPEDSAAARARCDFPTPGGPYSSTPHGNTRSTFPPRHKWVAMHKSFHWRSIINSWK